MCEAKPGARCAAETAAAAQAGKDTYACTHPDGPQVGTLDAAHALIERPVVTVPEGKFAVWTEGDDGHPVLHTYDTLLEQGRAYDAFKEAAGGRMVMMRPAKEDSTVVARLFSDSKRSRALGAERAGLTPGSVRVGDHLRFHARAPRDVEEAFDLVGVNGPYEDDESDGAGPWTGMAARGVLNPHDEVHSTQEFVSGTHIQSLIEMYRTNGAPGQDVPAEDAWVDLPRLYADATGRRWVIDGHHKLIAARQAGVPIEVLTLSRKEVDEVAWWAEDDD